MSNELYNEILQNGLGLHSPSIDLAESTLAVLSAAADAINTLPVTGTGTPPVTDGFNQAVIDSSITAIEAASLVVTNSKNQMETALNDIFATINLAGSVNRIESAEGCAGLTNATGSLMGEADEFFSGISDTAQAQIDAVSAYFNQAVSVIDTSQALGTLNTNYIAFESGVNTLLARELALANQMINQAQSYSLSKSVDLMWSDPCAQQILDRTLSDEIKALLNG